MRDEVEDFSSLTPQQACERIGEFFASYSKSKRMSPEERQIRIDEYQAALRKLSGQIRKCKDVEERKELTKQQQEIKKNLNYLRKD
jgi:hypothetical protein